MTIEHEIQVRNRLVDYYNKERKDAMGELVNRDEMDMMNEHQVKKLAEETLKAHNMPTDFSYRHAFTLGLEKGAELAGAGGGLSGLMAWMATAKAQREKRELQEKLDHITSFVDRNQWIGNDEKLIIMQIAEGTAP